MVNLEKSLIFALSENLIHSKRKAFFIGNNRPPNPSLPTFRYIKDSLTIIGRGGLLILKIMSENRNTPKEVPFTDVNFLLRSARRYLSDTENLGPIAALEQLFYLAMTSNEDLDTETRAWLTECYFPMHELLENIEYYNEN